MNYLRDIQLGDLDSNRYLRELCFENVGELLATISGDREFPSQRYSGLIKNRDASAWMGDARDFQEAVAWALDPALSERKFIEACLSPIEDISSLPALSERVSLGRVIDYAGHAPCVSRAAAGEPKCMHRFKKVERPAIRLLTNFGANGSKDKMDFAARAFGSIGVIATMDAAGFRNELWCGILHSGVHGIDEDDKNLTHDMYSVKIKESDDYMDIANIAGVLSVGFFRRVVLSLTDMFCPDHSDGYGYGLRDAGEQNEFVDRYDLHNQFIVGLEDMHMLNMPPDAGLVRHGGGELNSDFARASMIVGLTRFTQSVQSVGEAGKYTDEEISEVCAACEASAQALNAALAEPDADATIKGYFADKETQ